MPAKTLWGRLEACPTRLLSASGGGQAGSLLKSPLFGGVETPPFRRGSKLVRNAG